MTITVGWDNAEKTTLRYNLEGRWDWNSFYAALKQADALMDTVMHEVDIIVDISQSQHIPEGMISHIGSLGRKVHRNAGLTTLVGTNRFVVTLFDLFRKIRPQMSDNVRIVPSLEEARSILATKQSQISGKMSTGD